MTPCASPAADVRRAGFFLLVGVVFITLLYRCTLRTFKESERANEMREEYSDYDQRERPTGGGRRRKIGGAPKGKRREYTPHEHL